MPLHWQGSGKRGCWGHSGPCPSSPLPIPCRISPALRFPLFTTLKLFLFPLLHPWQRWAVLWGPGGRGAGAAPRAGLAAGPAAARSLSRPGTEGIRVLTSSSAAAAWGSTRPAGRPKVTWAACCPPAWSSPFAAVPAARPGVSLIIPVPLTAALLPGVAKILPNSFSQDFRDPW